MQYNWEQAKKLKAAFAEWFNLDKWHQPIAATLTLKQGIHLHQSINTIHGSYILKPEGFGNTVWVDIDKARQNFKHFINLLNKKVYGSAYKRHGKQLFVIPVLEGGGDTRYHYHCVIESPTHISDFKFKQMIKSSWRKTIWGYNQTKLISQCDDGWVDYILKFKYLNSFEQAIDLENLHIE